MTDDLLTRRPEHTAAAQDAELACVLEQYLAGVEAGRPANPAELIAAHPHLAARLEGCLASLRFLEHAGGEVADAIGSPRSEARTALGDFRIEREIGRGGMGVVYEAEQLSLGRRVALKVLPFAAMLDQRQLARFKNEARAAASLHHPHIVPVYFVGADRGVHYYAMQYIEGHSLARFIEPPPSAAGFSRPASSLSNVGAPSDAQSELDTQPIAALPTRPVGDQREHCRTVARLGLQAAEALHYAHQSGIVHRDVKPSNLLLGRSHLAPRDAPLTDARRGLHHPLAERDDYTPHLWVTDFGLARTGADPALTMTGDLVGTLRYMSPEQVRGKTAVLDHRSDVYSLGVTLYELLVRRPAFAGENAEQLLRQVADDDPPAPRSLDRSIPVDLETIVLKAMRKDPDERYAAAQDLADDLQRFLDARPIVARRPTWREYLVSWSRRHAALVGVVSVCCLSLSIALAIGVAMLQRAHQNTVAALARTSDLLYEADMAAAYQAHEKGWDDEAKRLLNRHAPQVTGLDRPGLEWHWLNTIVATPDAQVLASHPGPVHEIAVFPDGQRLASVGEDGTLRIWNIATGRLLETVRLGNKPLYSVAVSPDGRLIAAGSTSVFLYDRSAGKQVREIYRDEHNVESMAFTRDGRSLAIGTRYDEVCLLATDGTLLKCIPCLSRVESLEYVAGESTLLIPFRRVSSTSKPNGIVQLWSDDLSATIAELDATQHKGDSRITVARSSPGGDYVACGESYRSKVLLMDRETGKVLAQTTTSRDRITDIAYAPDGATIAVGCKNGRVECFRIQQGKDGRPQSLVRQQIIDGHQGQVTCLRYLGDHVLVTSGQDGKIRRWDASPHVERSIDMRGRRLRDIDVSPDGRRLLVASTWGALIVDVDSGEVLVRIDKHKDFTQSAWAGDGSRFALIDFRSRKLNVYDLDGGLFISRRLRDPRRMAISPDGSQVAVVDNSHLTIYGADDGSQLEQIPLQSFGEALVFSHGGSRLAYSERFHGITILDLALRRTVARMTAESPARQLAFDFSDSTIASGHLDSTIGLWDVASGKPRGVLVGHEREVSNISFSPDGRSLLSSSKDGTLRIWSTASARQYGILSRAETHSNYIFSLSADGRRLAATDTNRDRTKASVLLWEF